MQRRVANNLVWMLVERGLQVGAGIGIVAMLARGLGPEGFAHIQYAQAVVYIASSIALICGGEVVIPRWWPTRIRSRNIACWPMHSGSGWRRACSATC